MFRMRLAQPLRQADHQGETDQNAAADEVCEPAACRGQHQGLVRGTALKPVATDQPKGTAIAAQAAATKGKASHRARSRARMSRCELATMS